MKEGHHQGQECHLNNHNQIPNWGSQENSCQKFKEKREEWMNEMEREEVGGDIKGE